MRKNMFLIVAITGFIFFITSCNDPNESGVSDDIDFKSSSVTHDRTNVTTDVVFYSNYGGEQFFYYYNTDDDEGAEFMIRCDAEKFTVSKESAPGLHNVLTYTGTPTISNTNYHLEFPLSALELDASNEFTVQYWFFEISQGDRMPNSGTKSLSNIL